MKCDYVRNPKSVPKRETEREAEAESKEHVTWII